MMTLRPTGAGGSARGRPRPGVRLALLALAVAALGSEGCSMLQSIGIGDGCNKCGLRRPRIFARRDPGCATCGPEAGVGGATVIEGAASSGMSMPGTVITPGAAPAPAPSPADSGTIPDLAPADEPPPGGSSRSSGSSPTRSTPSTGAATKSNYQTYHRARPRPPKGGGLARALPPLVPTPRSAPEGGVTLSDNLLDNLPAADPVDSPPAPSEPDPRPAPAPAPAAAVAAPADLSPPPPADVDPGPAPEARKEDVPASVAIGIARFRVVDAQLAGGSFPSAGGWAWLAEKSYRTVLDLREPDQFRPDDLAAIAHQGLRYIALPVTPAGINADLLKRFDRELAQAEARPLYFCDADGTRAATLWYLRRVTSDHFDRPTARREAAELGPLAGPFLLAADVYLDGLNPARPAEPAIAPKPAPSALAPARASVSVLDPSVERPSAPVSAADPAGWHPYAALALTALGVPVAYWSRSAFSFRSIRRASLSGPGPRRKALPPSSDA